MNLFSVNSNKAFALFGLVVLITSVVITFSSVLPVASVLVAPDAMPFQAYPWRTQALEGLLAGQALTPYALYGLLFHPLVSHELTFMVDTLVLALGGVYYLRARGVRAPAAWAGGIALGLSGYTFTLFCAGHRGYFHMFSSAVWGFGLLARGFETRRLLPFALLGLVFAWGVPYQPDVLLLVGAVAAAYALWLTVLAGRAGAGDGGAGPSRPGFWRAALAVWPRFGVSLLVLALVCGKSVWSTATVHLVAREVQIAGATGGEAQPAEGRTAGQARERWLFATNWSLPPEDVLEFAAPGVFGDESMQGSFPYWGRLGRPDASQFQKGRMMPNYRGHTVYLGLIPLLFALLAATFWPSRRSPSPVSRPPSPALADVPFWCGVWAVCLVLAFGRFTPVYRLFYAIPYMDYIRAPVKFLHLVELATAALAGFGAEAFLREGDEGLRTRRRLARLAGAVAGLCAVAALVAVVARPSLVRHIAALGLAPAAEALGGYAARNLLRAAALAALVGAAALAALRPAWRGRAAALVAALTVALAADQASVARRYVKAISLDAHYRENAVVRRLRQEAGAGAARVLNYATPNDWMRDWFSASLGLNGLRLLTPSSDQQGTPYLKLFETLGNEPQRLWRALRAEYLILPRAGAEPLVRAGALRPLLDFELGAGTVRQVPPGEKTLLLAAAAPAPAAPALVARWRGGVAPQEQPEALRAGAAAVSEAPAPEAQAAEGPAGEVRVLAARGRPGVLATRLAVRAKRPGLLVLGERPADDLEVRVNGAPQRVYLSDAAWASVLVPAGASEVVVRKRREPLPLALALGVYAALAGAGAAGRLRRRRPAGDGAAAA